MAELNAGRPEATEPEIVPIFKPGAIIFRDSQYGAGGGPARGRIHRTGSN